MDMIHDSVLKQCATIDQDRDIGSWLLGQDVESKIIKKAKKRWLFKCCVQLAQIKCVLYNKKCTKERHRVWKAKAYKKEQVICIK